MTGLDTGNIVSAVVALLAVLIPGGVGAFVVAIRKDRRAAKVDDLTILESVRKIAKEEVEHVARQLREERRQRARVESRVEQLTEILRSHGIPVPDWPPALRAVNVGDRE